MRTLRPAGEKAFRVPRKALWAVAWLIMGVVLTLLFLGYRQPGLLIDFVNLRYCG
jgi:quinol-cytochrome oxidoreductase complex cytochrome b subunit